MKEVKFKEQRRFIARLISDLHQYGTSTYALELMIQDVASFFDMEIALVATPTSVSFTLRSRDKEHEYTNCLRVAPKSPDLGALADVHQVIHKIADGDINLKKANKALDDINARGHRYPMWARALAFSFSGAGFAMLMHTNLMNIICAAILGFIVFALSYLAEKKPRIEATLEPLVTLCTSIFACFIESFGWFTFNVELAVLSSVIIFIPGLSLTVGLNELSQRHLVSGTAKIMDAMMIMFKLYFGAFLGVAISEVIWGPKLHQIIVPLPPLPEWSTWFAVFMSCGALAVVFDNRVKDVPFALLAGFIAYGFNVWGSTYFDDLLGVFVGAFALGVYCNVFSWLANAPAALLSLHGLVVLVPGSKIFIAIDNLVTTDEIVHVEQLGQKTLLILMSLVAGFIFANTLTPPKSTV